MSKSLKIYWCSNANYSSTGYGNQTDLFTRILKQRGHQTIVRAFHGQHNATIVHDGTPILPMSFDMTGQDVLEYDYTRYSPDVMVLLYDIWPYSPATLDKVPLTAYAPIDHDPAPPQVVDRLRHCQWIWAMSRFGERKIRETGLDCFYMPHAVDTKVYTPVDRAVARDKWGIAEDRLFIMSNSANKGYPSRKNLDKILKAWSLFVRTHPTALLYIHTTVSGAFGGYDLRKMVEFYDIPDDTLRFPDQDRMRDGEIHNYMLNHLYNAADMLLQPSQGEGFCIPLIEAQAAGCPVAVTDFTAQSELCGAGYKIPVDLIDDLYYTGLGSEQAWGRTSEILKALEWAAENRGNTALRTRAREFALGYDIEAVFERYTLPSLQIMAQANAELVQRKPVKIPRPIPDGRESAVMPECKAKGHAWAPVGIWDNGQLCYPCTRKDCEAELRHDPRGDHMTVIPDGFKSEVNGIHLDVDDDPICKVIMREVKQYDLDSIDYQTGDVVVDIGAHVGIVSIYLAKRYGVMVCAYEPVPDNYNRLMRNIKANGTERVIAFNEAVTSDGRNLILSGNPTENSGGISAFTNPNGHSYAVQSIALATIFQTTTAERIKLLKIDCEGAEYEILQAHPELLDRVDHLRGEFHQNARLRNLGYDPDKLIALCQAHIPDVKVTVIEMSA